MTQPANPAMTQIAALTQGQAGRLRRAAILSVLAEALWILQAVAIAGVIAELVAQAPGASGRLITGVTVFALIGVLRAGLTAGAGHLLARAGDALTGELRAELLAQSDRRGVFGNSPASAAIAALATDKLALLLPYLRRWTAARLRVAVIPLLIIAVALPLSWVVALIFLVTGPLIPVFMALVGMAAGRASQDRMDEISDMNALLVERLTALTDIRLLDAGQTMLSGFADAAHRLRRRTMRVLALAFLSSTVLELFAAIGVAMTAIFVGFSLLGLLNFGHWGHGLSIGEGVFLLMLAPGFYQPMRDLAAAWHDRADALALARDLTTETERTGDVILGSGGQAARMDFALLETRGLCAGQRDLPDLTLRRGEAVAVTGPSGQGKTRLLLMLAGLSDPAPGRVLIDEQPLTDKTADGWRAALALIPQRPHFGDETLADYLTGGQPRSEDEIGTALQLAAADQVVARLPQGLNAHLGEQGSGVSGGEARRLMIARAALRQPALLLADEPTADLDDHTAAQVIAALTDLHRKGTTLIVASHDPRLISAMSREVAL